MPGKQDLCFLMIYEQWTKCPLSQAWNNSMHIFPLWHHQGQILAEHIRCVSSNMALLAVSSLTEIHPLNHLDTNTGTPFGVIPKRNLTVTTFVFWPGLWLSIRILQLLIFLFFSINNDMSASKLLLKYSMHKLLDGLLRWRDWYFLKTTIHGLQPTWKYAQDSCLDNTELHGYIFFQKIVPELHQSEKKLILRF